MQKFFAMYKIIVFGISILFSSVLWGQTSKGDKPILNNPGITIKSDARLDSLITLQQAFLEENQTMKGWRVQIFFEGGNNSHQKALAQKSSFITNHQDIPVYLIFNAPYYKVRVGDFRKRSEAELFLETIKSSYPNAFIVKEEINFPPN